MSSLKQLIAADVRANRGNPKAVFIMVLFRVAAGLRHPRERPPRLLAVPFGVFYRLTVDWVLGVEIPWRARIGAGLSLPHSNGIVIHDDAVIGCDVTLRQQVTIGKAKDDGGVPTVEDGVDFGAGARVLGDVRVGRFSVVGAGAVVLRDVPERSTVVGVPARVVASKDGV